MSLLLPSFLPLGKQKWFKSLIALHLQCNRCEFSELKTVVELDTNILKQIVNTSNYFVASEYIFNLICAKHNEPCRSTENHCCKCIELNNNETKCVTIKTLMDIWKENNSCRVLFLYLENDGYFDCLYKFLPFQLQEKIIQRVTVGYHQRRIYSLIAFNDNDLNYRTKREDLKASDLSSWVMQQVSDHLNRSSNCKKHGACSCQSDTSIGCFTLRKLVELWTDPIDMACINEILSFEQEYRTEIIRRRNENVIRNAPIILERLKRLDKPPYSDKLPLPAENTQCSFFKFMCNFSKMCFGSLLQRSIAQGVRVLLMFPQLTSEDNYDDDKLYHNILVVQVTLLRWLKLHGANVQVLVDKRRLMDQPSEHYDNLNDQWKSHAWRQMNQANVYLRFYCKHPCSNSAAECQRLIPERRSIETFESHEEMLLAADPPSLENTLNDWNDRLDWVEWYVSKCPIRGHSSVIRVYWSQFCRSEDLSQEQNARKRVFLFTGEHKDNFQLMTHLVDMASIVNDKSKEHNAFV